MTGWETEEDMVVEYSDGAEASDGDDGAEGPDGGSKKIACANSPSERKLLGPLPI
jgi:hypothetical protein